MLRSAFAAVFTLTWLGLAAGQEFPFGIPKPLGGPIVGTDGRIRTGIDAHPVQSPWTSAFDFGLSGSYGNTETLKIRAGLDVRYDTPEDVLILNALYIVSLDQGEPIENKVFGLVRNEMPMDMGLSWYAQVELEYDQARTVDLRLASHSGLSFTAVDDGTQQLKVRAGAGEAREWGGTSPPWVTEGQAGFDYEYKLTAQTRFTMSADYFPDVANFAIYRVRARVSFDILLDQQANIVLRLGAFDRYDSKPYGSKRNDLDYAMTLQFRF